MLGSLNGVDSRRENTWDDNWENDREFCQCNGSCTGIMARCWWFRMFSMKWTNKNHNWALNWPWYRSVCLCGWLGQPVMRQQVRWNGWVLVGDVLGLEVFVCKEIFCLRKIGFFYFFYFFSAASYSQSYSRSSVGCVKSWPSWLDSVRLVTQWPSSLTWARPVSCLINSCGLMDRGHGLLSNSWPATPCSAGKTLQTPWLWNNHRVCSFSLASRNRPSPQYLPFTIQQS